VGQVRLLQDVIYRKDLLKSLSVMPEVLVPLPHLRPRERLETLFDGEWQEFDDALVSTDPLGFTDTKPYAARLKDGKRKTNVYDALISAEGLVDGRRTIIAAMEYAFHRRLDGVVVGEKVTRCVERAERERVPLVVIACSGGARMMEGALSLMQLAKISAALARLDEARVPFVSILTDPTTGGVTASFAMLGDVNIAEPGALIGFAGRA